ncbi:MAG: HNH/endonuclease VII fold putative polymorphic toxin [Candidatus Xenobiia bacterium LiM19]
MQVTKPNKYQEKGRQYEFENGTTIRDDAYGHKYTDDPSQNLPSHFNDKNGIHYIYGKPQP